MTYLTNKDNDAYLDYPEKRPIPIGNKECPVCEGHGGWNLKLNAYGEGKHFKCTCSHCNGWGYIDENEICSGHEWQWVANLGNCYNKYECTKCHKTWDVDSSG